MTSGFEEVIKTIGCGHPKQEVQKLIYLGRQEIEGLITTKLFISESDILVEQAFEALS